MSKIHMTLRKIAPRVARIGLLMAAVAIVVSEISIPVSAITNVAPDPRTSYDANSPGFTAGSQIYMEVAQGGGGSLDAPDSKVIAYIPVSGGGGDSTVGIRLIGADHCEDGSGRPGIDSSNPVDGRSWDTTFTLSTSRQSITHQNQVRSGDVMSWSGCNTDPNDFMIAVGDGDRLPPATGLNGYYRVIIQAHIENGSGTNAFKVMSLSGGYVSFTDTSGVKFALQQREGRGADTVKSDFNIYFATPCNSAATETKQLQWFDADMGDFTQSPSNYGFNLYQRARGSGGAWTPVIWNYTNLGGNNVPNGPSDGWWDFRKDQEYRWEWYGVSANNGIQFQVPFDSVYSAVSCEGGDFQLNPVLVSASPSIVTPATNTIGVTARVDRSGTTASYTDEEWRVTKFILPPGGALGGGGTGSPPCNQFSGYSACNTVWSAGGVTFTNTSTTVVNNGADGVDHTLQPGTKICYVASVSKWSTGDPRWKHSNTVCSTVVQIPFAYVRGNDLRVGSGFSITNNSTSLMSGYVTPVGATWEEYGVLAPGTVSGVASQSGAVNGGSASAQNTWSKLTFANTGGSYGNFASAASMGAIPNVSNFLSAGTFSSFEKRDKGSANVTISSELTGAYAAGNFKKSVVIITSGTVTIDTDIKYTTDTLVGKAQLPQLVIIAGNINITDNVKQVDAWLVSTGTVNTCSNVVPNAASRTNLRTTNCSNSLHIDGPIMASQLLLARTYYDSSKAQAAENLNMRGDAYVWADQVSRDNADWHTTYSTDLPPRY